MSIATQVPEGSTAAVHELFAALDRSDNNRLSFQDLERIRGERETAAKSYEVVLRTLGATFRC